MGRMSPVLRGIAVRTYARGGELPDQSLNSVSGVMTKQFNLALMPPSSKTVCSTCMGSQPATARVASQADTH